MNEAETTQQSASAEESNKASALEVLEKALSESDAAAAATAPAATEQEPEAEAKPEEVAEAKSEKTEAEEAEANRIAVYMRSKAKATKLREEAERAAAQRLQQVEAKEREIEDKYEAIRLLRDKPLDGLKKLGIDPRQFFEKAIEEPEKLDPNNLLKSELEELRAEHKKLVDSIKQEREEAERRATESKMEAVRRQFVNETLNGNHPALKAFFGNNPRGLVTRAEALLRECADRGLDPADISNSEIAEYLEQEAREHYNSLKRQFEQFGAEPTQAVDGNVTLSGKATAPKLSRSKKTLAEMSEDERRAEALRALEQG